MRATCMLTPYFYMVYLSCLFSGWETKFIVFLLVSCFFFFFFFWVQSITKDMLDANSGESNKSCNFALLFITNCGNSKTRYLLEYLYGFWDFNSKQLQTCFGFCTLKKKVPYLSCNWVIHCHISGSHVIEACIFMLSWTNYRWLCPHLCMF